MGATIPRFGKKAASGRESFMAPVATFNAVQRYVRFRGLNQKCRTHVKVVCKVRVLKLGPSVHTQFSSKSRVLRRAWT